MYIQDQAILLNQKESYYILPRVLLGEQNAHKAGHYALNDLYQFKGIKREREFQNKLAESYQSGVGENSKNMQILRVFMQSISKAN